MLEPVVMNAYLHELDHMVRRRNADAVALRQELAHRDNRVCDMLQAIDRQPCGHFEKTLRLAARRRVQGRL